MYFETHAHYDDPAFDADREELLARVYEAGVRHVVVPATDLASSARAVALAERFPFVYAAVGFHPEDAASWTPDALPALRAMLRHEKVVAVGEIGLDRYWDSNPPPEQQETVLEAMFRLAEESGKPVIFHERSALQPSLEAVRRHPTVRGVFHCFSGSPETALELVSLGWYVSFTGVLTFKNARRAPEAAAAVPADRLMIETDSPYMAPVPHRGERNSSLFLPEIAAALGTARGISADEAARLTERNALRFFGLETADDTER